MRRKTILVFMWVFMFASAVARVLQRRSEQKAHVITIVSSAGSQI